MGIRASSGGQLGGSGGSGLGTGTLTVEQVQDIISESLLPSTTVDGLTLTSAYNDVTGKITLSLGTPPSAPIAGIVPASIEVEKYGTLIGSATAFNFAGTAVGAISIADNVATINIVGGTGGSGDGIGISNANINNAGNLILTLTDGSVIDTGHVVGTNGLNGTSGTNGVSITGLTVNASGQLLVQLSSGQQINAGTVVGPQGLQGPFGPQGAVGAKGDTGATGLKGDTGATGATGLKGDIGLKGDTGATGAKGDTGTQGVQGIQGPAGRSVTTSSIDSNGNLLITLSDGTIVNAGKVVGAQGTQGIQGLQGIQGVKGDTGASIASAEVNASGHLIITKTDGVTVDAGTVVGPQGAKGDTGTIGSQGIQGPAGVSVASGTVDASGHLILTKSDSTIIDAGLIVGPQGAKGDTGATGVKGDTGTAGTSYSVNNKSGSVQVFGLSTTAQAGYDLEVDLANKANKLATARNITLSGKVTGLTSFDGSGNVTMITSLSGVTTSDVAEGTNKYYTDAKARAALSTGTGLSYNSATGTVSLNANTDQVTEGTNNLYFTNNRFDNRLGQSSLAQFSDVANTSPTTGQALVWNGSAWTPGTISGGGITGGTSSGVFKATVQVDYDTNGNLSSVSVLNGGISAVITTATSTTATVTFTFTGSTCAPLSTQVYGYQRSTNVYVTRALASDFPTRTIAAGGASGSPSAFNNFDATNNTMTLGLTKAVTGAVAGIGQTTHCVLQFLLSSI